MAGQLARCLCASSLLVVSMAGAQERTRLHMEQGQLEDPALVSAWLKKNAALADRQRAAQFHAFGAQEEQRGSLSTALKAYGESALWMPSPQALRTVADLAVRYYGQGRAANKSYAEGRKTDLIFFEKLYRSALASDDVLATLNPAERLRIEANADCLATYRRNGTGYATCPPLQAYHPGKR